MIRTILLASGAALCLVSTAMAETKTYDADAFTGLDVSAGIDVSFETGADYSVSAENTNGDFSDLRVEVKNGTLHVGRVERNWNGFGKRERYSVTVTAPALSKVKASSGSDVTGTGLSGEQVKLASSSGADINVTGVQATKVSLSSSSGSDLNVSGTCVEVTADSSSGSDIRAAELICEDGNADASSGSDIEIHTTKRISADASSGGDVNVYGGPRDADIDKSSGGSVKIRS